jgi:hypothetical protein
MGQIIIDIPTSNTNKLFKASNVQATAVFKHIQNLGLVEIENPAIESPRRNSFEEDLKAVFGMWADREETGEEIAMAIRKANRWQQ